MEQINRFDSSSFRSTSFSKSIDWLKVICAIFVVLLHSRNEDVVLDGSISSFFQVSISCVLCSVAVPLFFFLSGFLFAVGFEKGYNPSLYKRKIISRIKSLLVPYFLWNCLFLVAFSVLFHLFDGKDLLYIYHERGVYGSFWSYNGFPIDYPLWFIRDLMVQGLLFPILFYIIKKAGILGACVLMILYLWGVKIPVDGLSIISLFFFYMGSLSWYRNDISRLTIPETNHIRMSFKVVFLSSSLLLFVLSVLFYHQPAGKLLIKLFDITAIPVLCLASTKLVERNRAFEINLTECTFFVFAVHALVIFCFKQVISYVPFMIPNLLIYIGTFVFALFFSCFIYYFLKRLTPTIISALSGYR